MNAKKKEWDLDNPHDKDAFEDMMNEIHGDVNIAGLDYATAYALKMVDEIAYRTYFNDWSDSIEDEWECGKCGQQYGDEEEAEECCKDEEVERIIEESRNNKVDQEIEKELEGKSVKFKSFEESDEEELIKCEFCGQEMEAKEKLTDFHICPPEKE
jgi:hypothetical protein